MGKPAARLGDLTAHGGTITGPGCPTVLIGNMPAACLGDMHVCPMVTPAPVPVPHVGGPISGPGCPTVLIGGRPAATMGDLCVCVGPPSSIILGCPTVLIGMAGGGGSGGGGSASAAEKTIQGLKSGEIKAVKGSESFPIEVQAALVEAAKTLPPGAVEGAIKEKTKPADEKRLHIADFVEILNAEEKESGFESARFIASGLNYDMLCAMARMFVEGIDTDAKNDPNRMPSKYMLLYGADDSKLKEKSKHPDSFDGQPEHLITVANLRRSLKLLGYNVKETGVFDDEVYNALTIYCSSLDIQNPEEVSTCIAQEKETIGTIAKRFGLPSWKDLYNVNKDKIGDNPDMLKPGTELKIPHRKNSNAAKRLKEKGGEPDVWFCGTSYHYPWVAFSASMITHSGAIHTEKDPSGKQSTKFKEPKKWVIRDNKTGNELAAGTINESDELQTLVPDSHDAVLEIDGSVCHIKS